MNTISNLRREAKARGLFLPVSDSSAALHLPCTLHGHTVCNRRSLQVFPVWDAENGSPTQATQARYVSAAQSGCGLVWSEPMAICDGGKRNAGQLCLNESALPELKAMVQAMRSAAPAQQPPVLIALLDHGGRSAEQPQCIEHRAAPDITDTSDTADIEPMTDSALQQLVVAAGEAACVAEAAGFDGIAFNAAHGSLFDESLSAFSRDGIFGGDFDDRTRFLRDCYTAAKLTTNSAFLAICLNLCDGIAQPYGWGMAFEDFDAPDISEPSLLLQILRELYDVMLVACEVDANDRGTADVLAQMSLACTCTAMLDSALQENVHLVMPACSEFAENIGAAMVQKAFASFAAV